MTLDSNGIISTMAANERTAGADEINLVEGRFTNLDIQKHSQATVLSWSHLPAKKPAFDLFWAISGYPPFLDEKIGQLRQAAAMVSLYLLANPQLPAHSAHLVFRKACMASN